MPRPGRGRSKGTSTDVEQTEGGGSNRGGYRGRGGRGKRQKEALLEQNLLNHNTKSCTAVSLVNYKLLITDNDISESTGENNQNIPYINTILVKLAKLADNFRHDKSLNEESLSDLFVDLFIFIFEGKFKGEETGYLSSIKGDYKEEIKQCFINFIKSVHFKKGFDNIASMKQYVMRVMFLLLNKVKHSEQKVHTAIGLGIAIIWRLQKMVPYLVGNEGQLLKGALDTCQEAGLDDKTEEDELSGKQEEIPNEVSQNIQVIRYKPVRANRHLVPSEEDQAWLKSGESGCAVLAVNRQGTHAELRSVDCLIASSIIQDPATAKEKENTKKGVKFTENLENSGVQRLQNA